MDSDPTNVPDGYDQGTIDPKLGRPKEKVSDRNTQDSAFGKDRLGAKGMKRDVNEPKSSYKGKSPLALETLLSKIPMNTKKLVFEDDNKGESLLDESNIKEQ